MAARREVRRSIALVAGLLLGAAPAPLVLAAGQVGAVADPLEAGFRSPPAAARPRVWWHWMNGNVTKDGIRKDIEWMHRVGIGGMQNFDAALSTPQVVDKRLVYMTPEWKDAFRYATELAEQHQLEFAIAASPGWSETGGPWVPPNDAMKKLVWSQTDVVGGKPFEGRLAPPPSRTGPYQALPPARATTSDLSAPKQKALPNFYADIAVLAYPVPDAPTFAAPRLSLAGGRSVEAPAEAGDGAEGFDLPLAAEGSVVSIDYPSAQPIRSATLYIPGASRMFFGETVDARLEVADGSGWRKVTDVPITPVPTTVSFAPISAKSFRLIVSPKPRQLGSKAIPAKGAALNADVWTGPPPKAVRIAELQLSPEARVNSFEAKAGFAIARDYYPLERPNAGGGAPLESIINLTQRAKSDGSLDWTPPPGRWRVLRLGYSLTGTQNHPATEEATGLEVDKFDGAAVRRYIEHYLENYSSAVGEGLIGAHGVRALLTDSIEVGASNWTPDLISQFKRLRGYDPTPWLPALTGAVIIDPASSDRFLYDFRRTLGDLIASQHYGELADAAHRHGMIYYSEALENGRPSLGDDMTMRTPADIPMSALWTHPPGTPTPTASLADMKGASSVAHLYGKPFVAAESLTTALQPWSYSPADLKPMMDQEFLSGINRPVIHTSVHQPVDDKVPGLSLSIYGQYFNRHDTWAEMAKPWVDYMARSSFLLQQGRNVADVAYFYGEEEPLTGLYQDSFVADAPRRYAYDFINADALLHALKAEQGAVVSAKGARYRLLYLGGSSARMTLPVLQRIAALAEAGATIVGRPPTSSPSQSDDPMEFRRLVARLWSGSPETKIGKGRVLTGADVEAALARLAVQPDLELHANQGEVEVPFVHRRTAEADIYFLDNRRDQAVRLTGRFRVSGRSPELWRADTDTLTPLSFKADGTSTTVPIELAPKEAVFAVFRHKSAAPSRTVAAPIVSEIARVDGAWTVDFQPGRGAPASIRLPALAPLNDQADPGVKYFSGVATYHKTIEFPAGSKPGARVYLDLGKVGDLASVKVNGKPAGYAWTAPFRVDVTQALHAGRNDIEVSVADLWVNRLIGDQQPGAAKVTYTNVPTYTADAPLRPSGLIGPVRLIEEK